MRLVYKNPVELGKIFSSISVVVNEVNIDFNEEGLSIFGLDGSHVSMVLLKIDSKDCVEYECEEPIRLGINLKTLTSILNTGKDMDRVKFENVGNDVLNIEIVSESRRIDYEIKLMEIVMEDLFIPELDYEVKLETSAGYFYGLLDSLNVVLSDVLCISVKGKKVEISGNGQLGNTRVELMDKKNEYKLESKGDIEQRYALVFIMKSKKMGEISKKMEILMAQDAPIQMVYKIGERSEMRYMLAPKIDD